MQDNFGERVKSVLNIKGESMKVLNKIICFLFGHVLNRRMNHPPGVYFCIRCGY